MKKYIVYIALILTAISCKKLTQVPEPVNTITTTETFNNSANATAAIMGIYYDLTQGRRAGGNVGLAFSNGLTTIDAGSSADELLPFGNTNAYQTNTLKSSSADISTFWTTPYYAIYGANTAIGALKATTGVDAVTKTQLLGEAKFLRALCYFYLVNLFGTPYAIDPNGLGVPLATTNAYAVNDTLHRATTAQVYRQIVADLIDAKGELAVDYSASGGQRIRVNQAGATALLARIYLYMGDYKNAYLQANEVINNNLYILQSDLNKTFLANNSEAILQWQSLNIFPFATQEGGNILPYDNTSPPNYFLTDQLLKSFEGGDKRKAAWVDSTNYGQYYYYPNKYKVYQGASGNITEFYMVLRLAEQYLIRAEAQANGTGNGLTGAINDLNVIRARAGLPALSSSLTQSQVLAAVMQERKIELFAEWGHRWLDLKRTGQAQAVLSTDKGFTVPANQLMYPIPASELINDNNLVQNPGY